MPVSVDVPSVAPTGTVPVLDVQVSGTVGIPSAHAHGTVPALAVTAGTGGGGTVPPSVDTLTATLYQADGLTQITPIRRFRGVQWLEQLSQPGTVTFEVAADDPACAQIGPLAGQKARIVKFTWLRNGVPITTVGCRIASSKTAHAVDGRVWQRWENQPGLLGLLADDRVAPEATGLPDTGVTDRLFGFMSTITTPWKNMADWHKPNGYPWSTTHVIRNGYPRDPEFKKYNPYWLARANPALTVPAGQTNMFLAYVTVGSDTAAEWFGTADNYLTLYLDGQEILTPNYGDSWAWKNAISVQMHLSAGTHLLAALVENGASRKATSPNPIGFIGILFSLNGSGNRNGVLRKTDLTNWAVAVGSNENPGVGWHAAAILEQLMHESQAAGAQGPSHLPLGFTHTVDTDGNRWTDIQPTKKFSVYQDSLLDAGQALAESAMDIGVDSVTMRLNAWQRRGKNRSGTVQLKLGKDGGTLKQYDTTVTHPQYTVVYVQLADGSWSSREDSAAVSAYGRIVSGLSVGSASSDTQAGDVVQQQLNENKIRRLEAVAAASTLASGGGPVPYIDYYLGDTITVPGHDSTTMKARVMAITVDASGEVFSADPTLAYDPTA